MELDDSALIEQARNLLCLEKLADEVGDDNSVQSEPIVDEFDSLLNLYCEKNNSATTQTEDMDQILRTSIIRNAVSLPAAQQRLSSIAAQDCALPRRETIWSLACANMVPESQDPPFSLAMELFGKVVDSMLLDANADLGMDLISAHNNMANIARCKGRDDNTVELYLKAIELVHEYGPEDPFKLASILVNLADFFEHKEQYKESEELFSEVLTIYKNHDEEKSPKTALVLVRLGKIYSLLGSLTLAKDAYRQALEIWRELNESHEMDMASTLSLLAQVTELLGDSRKAFHYHEQAVYLWNGQSESCDLQIVLEYMSMGHILNLEGQHTDALDVYFKAYQISESSFDRNNPLTACICHRIGKLCQETGKLDLAIDYFDKVLEIKEAVELTIN